MNDQTEEHEIGHALSLLADLDEGWTGLKATILTEPVCKFDSGAGPCDTELAGAMVFQYEGHVWLMVACTHHLQVLDAAVHRWREKS